MNRFQSKLVDDHVIIHLNGFDYIIDTGSPLSFGRGTSILINGKTFPITDKGPGGFTADSINKLSKLNVDGLIGMDILVHFDIKFDPCETIFSDRSFAYSDTAILFPIDTSMIVPIIRLNIQNKDRRIFFDTGAKLSYLSENLLDGTPIGQMEDFYPSIGTYQTNIYLVDVKINEKNETFTFGLLPSQIKCLLKLGQTEGVIGSELLKKYSVILSNSRKLLILESHDHQSNPSLLRERSLD